MSDPNEAAPQVVDRKELLSQQFDEIETAASSQQEETSAAKADRARDEQGKFVAKEKGQEEQGAVPAPVEEPEWKAPPKSWKKDFAALWPGLDPKVQQYAYEREAQMRAGVEPLLPKAELADKISKVAEPYMNTIRGLGIELPQAVERLMQADHQLRTLPQEQKLGYLSNLVRAYGISLGGQPDQQRQPGQAPYDPMLQALQNEVIGVKGQLSTFLQQKQEAEDRVAMQEAEKIKSESEYFDEALPTMIKLLQSNVADNIKDAYEKAIRLDPELFDKVQSAKQASAAAEKSKAADAAAKRAKAAAVSVKSATPGTQKTTNAQDRRSMLIEQFDGLSERL